MSKTRFLHGKERLARVLAIGGVLGVGGGLFGFAQNSPGPPLVQPESPGVPVIGLRYFRLEPVVSDTTFRLLVIPVQFPEDGVLGGGSETEILDKLNGSDPTNLAGYYAHETAGRLHIVATLAPLVTAPHSRAYYTTEGGAYGSNGLDPRTYPHNGQGLVVDVTRALTDRVDFRLYDNTKDGIVDGLLILHSGPKSAETSVGALPADVLIAHAFTLPAQEPRGGSMVFPYALAATRDGIGVWAHEVGHLFGLPDLYVANSVCFGPGLGEWSLMATGANRGGGENPTGLDAFCLQLLGMRPRFDDGNGVALSQGVFLRASDPGEESGPRYYLVDFRESGDGPAGSTPTRLVYLVNEEAVDNRSCSNPSESYRPLVRVAAVVCPGDTACAQSYYQTCELCPNVGFAFSGTTVHVQSGALPPIVLSRVQLGVPQMGPGGSEEKRVYLSFRNVDADAAHTVELAATPAPAYLLCLIGPTIWNETIEAGATKIDSSLSLVNCSGSGRLEPNLELTLFLQTSSPGTSWSRQDTLVLPTKDWLGSFQFYELSNLNPETTSPWNFSGHPVPTKAIGTPLASAHGEIISEWFSVPTNGRVTLIHRWNLEALSPDVALDAGQVRLRRAVGADVVLIPPLGWGYTTERGVGNALGGQEVVSGMGARDQVFDISQYAGDVARLVFVVAGDAQENGGEWSISYALVQPAPETKFSLEEDPPGSGTLVAVTSSPFKPLVSLVLYRGMPGVVPVDNAVWGITWSGESRTVLGHFDGRKTRFELVWIEDFYHSDSEARIFDFPIPRESPFLLAPSPNPIHNQEEQTWAIQVHDDGPFGTYVLRLVSLDGGILLEQSLRIDVPGTRLILWDGQDGEGRTITSGIYFLEARRPDGVRNGQRIVVIP